MILTAGACLGIALARGYSEFVGSTAQAALSLWIHYRLGLVLLGLTCGFVAVRLRHPRPSMRVIMRQPGMIVAIAVFTSLLLSITAWLSEEVIEYVRDSRFLERRTDLSDVLIRYWRGNANLLGMTVLACSLALWAFRYSQRERGWIDRFGRALGWLWLAETCFGWNVIFWYDAIKRMFP
jgi:hypothetical protein